MNMVNGTFLNCKFIRFSLVRALYDYVAQKFDELSFREGDLIRVHSTDDPDWWDGEFQGEEGCFPASYVEKA